MSRKKFLGQEIIDEVVDGTVVDAMARHDLEKPSLARTKENVENLAPVSVQRLIPRHAVVIDEENCTRKKPAARARAVSIAECRLKNAVREFIRHYRIMP